MTIFVLPSCVYSPLKHGVEQLEGNPHHQEPLSGQKLKSELLVEWLLSMGSTQGLLSFWPDLECWQDRCQHFKGTEYRKKQYFREEASWADIKVGKDTLTNIKGYKICACLLRFFSLLETNIQNWERWFLLSS